MTIHEEFTIKLHRIRTLMGTKGLDAIYLKRQDDFAWLSCGGRNYVGIGDMGNCGLLVTHDSYHAITSTIESNRMMEEENLGELGFTMHAGLWHDNSHELTVIEELVPSSAVGCDYSLARYENISDGIKQLRLSLTENEISRFRELGSLASLVIEEAAMLARPNDSEYEILARAAEKARSLGLEVVSLMCAADDRISSYRHPLPTDRKARERVQIGGNLRKWGLTVCLTRYVNFVPVSNELAEQMRCNQEIDCIFMQETKVERPLSEILKLGKHAYEERGYAEEINKHHQGGPIGYAGRDYRVDFSNSHTVVENQGFCWNPSITGTKSEDTILVNSDGFEFITKPVLFPTCEIKLGNVTFSRADILQKLM